MPEPLLTIFHGMKRSGNHAVLNWIKSGGEFAFINNALPFRKLLAAGRLDAATAHPLPRLHGTKRHLISVEDMPVSPALFDGQPENTATVVLIRDPVNLFASRIRKGQRISHPAYPRTINEIMLRTIRLWKEHAQFCLDIQESGPDTLGILFDRWIADAEYRRSIARELNIAPDDGVLDVMAKEGGGSSFSEIDDFPGRADLASSLATRSANLNPGEKELLEAVMTDPEIHVLREKLFRHS